MNPRIINPDTLPILTEVVDDEPIQLPTLTEALDGHLAALPAALLTEQQCQQLAEQLFPQLEITLRAAIGSRSEAKWNKAMQQVQAALPELIQQAAQRP